MGLILIVNQDAGAIQAIEHCMVGHGYRVSSVGHHGQAVAAAQREHPDLILVDNAPPRSDGIQVCRQLCEDASLISHPVLFVTGGDSIESKAAAFEAGADDYLVKPFEMQELVLRIKALLARQQSPFFALERLVK